MDAQFCRDCRTPEVKALERLKAPRHIYVPTATLILCDEKDPTRILVGRSGKHLLPVLPGGKIDTADEYGRSPEDAALFCALRELREEVRGASAVKLRLIEVTRDADRDVRLIPARTLRGTSAEGQLGENGEDELVLAHYGVPDYLFVGTLAANVVSPSEELKELLWVDARALREELAAGHGVLVSLYLRKLGRL